MISMQLRSIFSDNERIDNRTFQVQAALSFDASGKVAQARLLQSTGNPSLDGDITRLVQKVDLSAAPPGCMQSVVVSVSEPWTGTSVQTPASNDTTTASSGMMVWQRHDRH
jgi:TonB family protein